VADQGVDVEHIVQDGGSDDGTREWAAADSRIKFFMEKDAGMYDAINRGWRRATGEILSYLNCDEQYLPGALARAGHFFSAHPEVDMVFGTSLWWMRADSTFATAKWSGRACTTPGSAIFRP
jgi:glycosyltransferase involved in cell wall biosynthesis